MKDWAWPLLVCVLALSAAVLVALRLLDLIAWPWWAALVPIWLLGSLVGYALVICDRLMREAAREPHVDVPEPWFEYTDAAHVDDH